MACGDSGDIMEHIIANYHIPGSFKTPHPMVPNKSKPRTQAWFLRGV